MCPSQGEVMRSGMAAEVARLLSCSKDNTAETATGSTQADAFVLTANITTFGTVAASTGCILPSATGVAEYYIFNNGANPLKVYPATGESINASSANTAFTVTNGKGSFFYPHGNIWMANLSA